jgi:hypothetical protein
VKNKQKQSGYNLSVALDESYWNTKLALSMRHCCGGIFEQFWSGIEDLPATAMHENKSMQPL